MGEGIRAPEGRSFLELEEGQAVRGAGQEDEPGKEGVILEHSYLFL